MNEKGFATVLGLCLILVIALIVKGIQEAEMNHAYETTAFQIEQDLQNAADNGIYKAVKRVHDKPSTLSLAIIRDREKYRVKIINAENISNNKNIKVTVWGERILLKPYEVSYKRRTNGKYEAYPFIDESGRALCLKGCAFLSIATFTDPRTGEKRYCRSYAYFVESYIKEKHYYMVDEVPVSEAEKNIIHFMKVNDENLQYVESNNPDRK